MQFLFIWYESITSALFPSGCVCLYLRSVGTSFMASSYNELQPNHSGSIKQELLYLPWWWPSSPNWYTPLYLGFTIPLIIPGLAFLLLSLGFTAPLRIIEPHNSIFQWTQCDADTGSVTHCLCFLFGHDILAGRTLAHQTFEYIQWYRQKEGRW